MKRLFASIVTGITGLVLTVAPLHADPVIDGVIKPSDGYTHVSLLAPSKYDAGKNPGDPAQMYLFQNSTTFDLSVGFVLPVTFVDNTYGVNSIGWGSKGHKFDELVGSDKAQFVISMGGVTKLDFIMDYLVGVSGGGYDSGLVGEGGIKTNKSGVSLPVITANTSLDYNVNSVPGSSAYVGKNANSPATDANYTPNPAIPDWAFEVSYEFVLDGAVLNNQLVLGDDSFLNGFQLKVAELHASPNKGSEFKNIIPPPPSVIPEPASASLLLLGAASMFLRRRRQA